MCRWIGPIPVERIATVLDAVAAVCVLTCGSDTVAGAGGRPVVRIDSLDMSGRCADPITTPTGWRR